ncbi:MAG: hypothetical protein ACUVWX_07035 [Kiritimatiellia bacterium]
MNVLGIEIHRSPFHPAALTWWNNPNDYPYGRISHWVPIGLERILFTATGEGVEPNLVRPAGSAVWTADVHERIYLDTYQEPGTSIRPLRFVGVRNGVYAAQLVVSARQQLGPVEVRVSDLTGRDTATGKKIPATSIQIRYLAEGNPGVGLAEAFDAVLDRMPLDRKPTTRTNWQLARQRKERGWPEPVPGVIQPIWLSLRIPRDAWPGNYVGSNHCFRRMSRAVGIHPHENRGLRLDAA